MQFSIDKYFYELSLKHKPKFCFKGTTEKDWQDWKAKLLPEVKKTLGRFPQKTDLNPQIQAQWNEEGLIKQKVVFTVEENLDVSAYVFRPESAKGKLPAILCCHGHGPFGKDAVMGVRTNPDICSNINLHNYDYGLQMAKAGFVTIAIDWRGFGE